MSGDAANQFAGVIILSQRGNYILQLRDDNPKIVDPGKLSIFAGRLKPGEIPADGAKRELFEETGLKLSDLEFFTAYQKDPARHGAPGICYIYVVKDIDPNSLYVQEGQGWREVPSEGLSEENTALISYDILQAYTDHQKAVT